MSFLGASIPKQCMAQVARHAGRVAGSRIYSRCEKDAVFVAPDGKCYCATHGKQYGYDAPEKAEKKDWIVFYTDENGKKGMMWQWGMVSERGVKQSMKRSHPELIINAIVPDVRDSKSVYPQYAEWF